MPDHPSEAATAPARWSTFCITLAGLWFGLSLIALAASTLAAGQLLP